MSLSYFNKSWTNRQFLCNYIVEFSGQCAYVVIFIAVSENFASTSQIGEIIDKIGVRLKGVVMHFLC